MSAEPIDPSSSPRRSTGDIPASWAMPAEAVTSASPAAKQPVSLGLIVVGLLVMAVAAFGVARLVSPAAPTQPALPPPPATTTTTTTKPAEVKPVAEAEAGIVVPPSAPVAVATPAAPPTQPAPTTAPIAATTAAADRAKAKQLVARARLKAKDGDVPGARDVAEDAVVADPACGECWKTLALLRKKTGDKAGAVVAKQKADALLEP